MNMYYILQIIKECLSKLPSEGDVSKILSSGPWFLNGTFISIQRWSPGFRPSEGKISLLPVWVELPELPVELHVEPILRKIGDSLGSFLKGDLRSIRENKLRYARILVLMDTSKEKKIFVWLGSFKQPLIFLDWPVVCAECAMINRHHRTCSKFTLPESE